jgi:hypothetical protein
VVVLSAIYEEDFLGFLLRISAQARPARRALWVGIMRKRVNWVLDADIRDFLDAAS